MIDGSKLNWTIETHPEQSEAEGENVAVIRDRLSRGDLWAWCRVIVRCWLPGFPDLNGFDQLPCASFVSEAQFADSSPFYVEMRRNAMADLTAKVNELIAAVPSLSLPPIDPQIGDTVYLSALPRHERYKLRVSDPNMLNDALEPGHVAVAGMRQTYPAGSFMVPVTELAAS